MTDVSDLVRRLEKLAKKNKEISLGRKITKAGVKAFEDKYGITLPDEYREFVLGAGEGASGPEYGMLFLDKAIEERGTTIYDLADPFPAPESTKDHLDFGVGGILPVQYSGCSYFSGIVTTGPDRGQMWFSVEDRPGWLPHCHGKLVDAKGKPFKRKGEDFAPLYDCLLTKPNRKLRVGFAAWYAEWLRGVEGGEQPS